jgi:hypothetical protein
MEDNRPSVMPPGRNDKGLPTWASTLNVTKIVLISVALFAVITQLLDAIGAITLSTTQQVTVWLVAAGLIVLLSIADLACQAYVTAAKYRPGEPPAARQDPPADTDPELAVPRAHVPPPRPATNGPGTPPPGPSDDGSLADDATVLMNGPNDPRLPVKMAEVFPGGCYLVPSSIIETFDHDEKAKTTSPSIDKITGKRVYQCRVVDMNPDPKLKGRSRETVVKIVANEMPVPPTGTPYEPVEFEGLTARPHATDRGQAAYASLRATGIKQAMSRPAPDPDTASVT